jgi:xanthine dehydrogenase accessory factor
MARSSLRVLIRGAGELASGVALRLFRCGFPVLLTELPEPLTVRRPVSFSDAVYTGQTWVEGVEARRAEGFRHALSIQDQGAIPVLVDPEGQLQALYHPSIVVDAATRAARPLARVEDALLVIGVGPTFQIGVDAHYAIETRQGQPH